MGTVFPCLLVILAITVVQAQNQPPVLQGNPSLNFTLPEDLPVDSLILSGVRLTDSDGQSNIQDIAVSCRTATASANVCSTFTIRTTTSSRSEWVGDVVLAQPMDIDQPGNDAPIYVLPLQATDGQTVITFTIYITVQDVQDTPPVFVSSTTFNVSDSSRVGDSVYTVQAEDGDFSKQRSVSLSLQSNPGNYFSLDSSSGSLELIRSLDPNDPAWSSGGLVLRIQACEMGPGTTSADCSEAPFTAILVENRAPQFELTRYSVTLLENSEPDTVVIETIQITDMDQGDYGYVSLSLSAFTDTFLVSPSEGQGSFTTQLLVRSSQILDYESNLKEFNFQLIARESRTQERKSSVVPVNIRLVDLNDNSPQFDRSDYRAQLSETASPGTPVITVSATDADSGDNGQTGLRYKIVGNGAERFVCNLRTGQITVADCPTNLPGAAPCLDYETQTEYTITVYARDRRGEGRENFVPLTIFLINENDNPPRFQVPEYVSYIREGQTVPSPQVQVRATDPDGGSMNYRIEGNNPGNLWQIGSTDGIVTAVRPVDYEAIPNNRDYYLLSVIATDGTFSVPTTVTIYVEDINDHPPQFVNFDFMNETIIYYTQTISETSPEGFEVVLIQATDADPAFKPNGDVSPNGQVQYRIMTGAQDQFLINLDTGMVTVAPSANLDFDVQNRYIMEIMAFDQGEPQKVATAFLIVNILDTNNKDPFFERSIFRESIKEDEPVGTSVITVTATDPDLDASLIYFIEEPIRAFNPQNQPVEPASSPFKTMFNIIQATGLVQVNRALDYDTVARYQAIVRAVDSAAPSGAVQSATATLIIDIIQVNSLPPIFGEPWTPERPEINVTVREAQPPGSYVTTLVASDPSDGIGEYTIITNPGNHFQVDPQTGVVTVRTPLDYETNPGRVSFILTASDGGQPPLTATATINVYLENINDETPIFDKVEYSVLLEENSPNGTLVVTVQATDLDLQEFGIVRYSLADPENRFVIDNVTGVIRVAPGAVLDYDTEVGPIVLTVTAYDTPSQPEVRRYANIPVFVTLTDVNDNPPTFTQDEYSVTILSTTAVDTPIIIVVASDNDGPGPNSNLTYDIRDTGNITNVFGINSTNGVIFTKLDLAPYVGMHNFTVSVRDGGLPTPREDTALVYITVIAGNNLIPTWVFPNNTNFTQVVNENEPNGSIVIDTHARSNNPGGGIEYYFRVGPDLVSTTNEFSINKITGVIRTQRPLDREQPGGDLYILQLVAIERGKPNLQATRYLIIRVGDVDDNRPEFPKYANCCAIPFQVEVPENVAVGTSVGRLLAEDADSDSQSSSPTYEITRGNDDDVFQINATTGEIFTNVPLNYNEKSFYNLTIRALSSAPQPEPNPDCVCTQSDVVLLYIYVLDVNTFPPRLTPDWLHFCVRSDAVVGSEVTTLQAVDPDRPDDTTAMFFYSIVPGSLNNSLPPPAPAPPRAPQTTFQLGRETGMLSTTTPMNTYTHQVFKFHVSVADVDALASNNLVHVSIVNQTDEVIFTFDQPPEVINEIIDSIVDDISEKMGGALVCVGNIRYHIDSRGIIVTTKTDLTVYVVENGTFYVYPPGEVIAGVGGIIGGQPAAVVAGYTAWGGFIIDSVLAAIILIFLLWLLLLILLLCLCCCWPLFVGFAGAAEKRGLITFNPFYGYGGAEEQELTMNVKENLAIDLSDGQVISAIGGGLAGGQSTYFEQTTKTEYWNNLNGSAMTGDGMAGGGGTRIEAELLGDSAIYVNPAAARAQLLSTGTMTDEAGSHVGSSVSAAGSRKASQRIGATLLRPYGGSERVIGENYTAGYVEYNNGLPPAQFRTLGASAEIAYNTTPDPYPAGTWKSDDVFMNTTGRGPSYAGEVRVRRNGTLPIPPPPQQQRGNEVITTEYIEEYRTEQL